MAGAPSNSNVRTTPLLIAAGLAQFICCADYFAAAIALPPMAKDLGVRAIDLQWVITGYILSFCATLCVAGVLGDRYGRKKLLLLGIVIFAHVLIRNLAARIDGDARVDFLVVNSSQSVG